MGFPNCPRKSLNTSVWNINLQCKESISRKELTMYSRKTADSTFKWQHRLCNSAGWKRTGAGAVQSHWRSALCYANMEIWHQTQFYIFPLKSHMLVHVLPLLSRPYAGVILLEKDNFIKLGEKPNCLKIGSGSVPAPRSACEAFRVFRQLRVFPQAITRQYFPLLPSENHKNICSNCMHSYSSTHSS